MNPKTNHVEQLREPVGADFFDLLWEESWTYIKTVVDVVRDPILILDKNLRVMAANESFYRTFHVEPKETQDKNVYELGNGQWDIPALRRFLDDILPNNSHFKGFEVTHDFPIIGRKTMLLNARRIYREGGGSVLFPPIILLAIEDISEMMSVAEMLSHHTSVFEAKMGERAEKLEKQIGELQKQIQELKK